MAEVSSWVVVMGGLFSIGVNRGTVSLDQLQNAMRPLFMVGSAWRQRRKLADGLGRFRSGASSGLAALKSEP